MAKKLLFVVNVDCFFVSHRLPIALAAKNAGYEVHVACAFTDKQEQLIQMGFVLHELSLSRCGTSLFQEINTYLSIRRLIIQLSPDVLHLITIKPVLYGGLSSQCLKGCIRVFSISGLGYVFSDGGFKIRALRAVVSYFYKLGLKDEKSKVVFQNPSDRDHFLKFRIVYPCQVVMTRGSGVFLNKYPALIEPEGVPVIILLARLLVDKGVYEFVRAAELLKSMRVSCRLALVGKVDENPRSVKADELEHWQRNGNVEYWGYSTDVVTTMSKANVVVLPSYYPEGLPKSLIEAASCQRAIITTDAPGCRDAIIPDKTGILIPPKDPEALAEAIKDLCENKEKRLLMAREGRLLAERDFDIREVIDTHLKVYAGVTVN